MATHRRSKGPFHVETNVGGNGGGGPGPPVTKHRNTMCMCVTKFSNFGDAESLEGGGGGAGLLQGGGTFFPGNGPGPFDACSTQIPPST